jgi:hypothetical protein
MFQCPCICHRGGAGDCLCSCSKYSNVSAHIASKPVVNTTGYCYVVDPNQVKYESLQSQIIAQEHTINHIQEGQQEIEKCFERIKKLEYWAAGVIQNNVKIKDEDKEEKPYENIFEFKRTYLKGTDDIRHVKNALYELYCWILDNVPGNKYRSNGIDLLEAAAMQLNKAISRRKDNGT